LTAVPEVNQRYTYSGSRENLPSRVFDDGRSTTFEWPQGVETPAIFVRRADGGEAVVNYSHDAGKLVVHQVAREFILRNGGEVTRLFNDGYRDIERGPDAPRPREKKKRGVLGIFNG
jgi:type IV secretion system protein VirB9